MCSFSPATSRVQHLHLLRYSVVAFPLWNMLSKVAFTQIMPQVNINFYRRFPIWYPATQVMNSWKMLSHRRLWIVFSFPVIHFVESKWTMRYSAQGHAGCDLSPLSHDCNRFYLCKAEQSGAASRVIEKQNRQQSRVRLPDWHFFLATLCYRVNTILALIWFRPYWARSIITSHTCT